MLSVGSAYGALSRDDIEKSLAAYQLTNTSVALRIIDAKNGKKILFYHEDKTFQPGSVFKLVTAAAALLYLGSDYRFKTTLYFDKRLSKHVINNLYIDFSGDPSLTTQDLVQLLMQLQKEGITEIKGDIYLVDRVFSGRAYPIDVSQSGAYFYYNAPVTAFNLNENAFPVTLQQKSKQFVVLNENEKVISHLRAADQKALQYCQFNANVTKDNQLILSGCLPARESYKFYFAIQDPGAYMQKSVSKTLSTLKIKVANKVVKTTGLPSGLTYLGRHDSATLSALVKHMLNISDNFYAQVLMKTLGQHYYGIGTFASGKKAITEILKAKLDINLATMQFEDGAGASEQDLISAHFLSDLLFKMQGQKTEKDFFNALPVAGISGTLKNRLLALKAKVYAKTGTASTATSLCGYYLPVKKERYIFCIMFNGIKQSQRSDAYQMIEAVLQKLKPAE